MKEMQENQVFMTYQYTFLDTAAEGRLCDVLTLTEAARFAKKQTKTIKLWCWLGKISYRQSDKVYLIDAVSLSEYLKNKKGGK